VFPGPKAKPDFYRDELVGRAGLLPASLGGIQGDPASDNAGFTLQASGYEHPVFALWNEAGAGSLAAARFRAAWELLPSGTRTNADGALETTTVMIRYSDGRPAALERQVGRGRVLLFSSTAGTAWNDFAVRPAFVPLLHRAVGSLTEGQETRYNVRAGDQVTLRLPAELAGREATIVTPERPERRLTRTLRATPGGAAFEFDETHRAGVYRVEFPGSSTPLARFAVRPDPAESDLTDLTPDRRSELDQVAQTLDWAPEVDVRGAFERERLGLEIWFPLVLGILLLGVTETWLAQRFSRPK